MSDPTVVAWRAVKLGRDFCWQLGPLTADSERALAACGYGIQRAYAGPHTDAQPTNPFPYPETV